jgi:hypothetical protein
MTAAIENGCGPLPVKFVTFTAQQLKNKVVLHWQTATEQNNRGFEIQRKLEGQNYKTIGFVASGNANGNSNQTSAYSYNDMSDPGKPGQVFYRLKQIDLDGNSSFSEVRFINYNMEETTVLIYPNPANGFWANQKSTLHRCNTYTYYKRKTRRGKRLRNSGRKISVP